MAKTIVGVDIGASLLKLALCSDGAVRKLVAEDMPDNMVRDGCIVSPEAMAQFIKETAGKARINVRNCAVILPAPLVFARTITLPYMSRDHLKLNLSYEFRDFITQEKDKYFYDYALTDVIENEQGEPQELEMIAATALKETIQLYSDMFRRAGFKLKTAIPEELSYINIIRRLWKDSGVDTQREYCFIDLGHNATKLHIFKGVKLQATRVMDFGMRMLGVALADKFGVDEHIASLRKRANVNNELLDEVCMNVYNTISIEVMRALNFYRFNNPESALQEAFLCGGGARIPPMLEQLAFRLDMPVHGVDTLLPDTGKSEDAILCPAAIGATMQ